MDQESEGTNLVIFVVGGVVLLLLLLGGGAFFFLMRAEGMAEAEALREEMMHKEAVLEGMELEKAQNNEPAPRQPHAEEKGPGEQAPPAK